MLFRSGWYSAGLQGSADYRNQAMRTSDGTHARDLTVEFFQKAIAEEKTPAGQGS